MIDLRKIDALVAEHIFNLKPSRLEVTVAGEVFDHDYYVGRPEDLRLVERYSSDIAAAWKVVEKLNADDWRLDLRSNDNWHDASFSKDGSLIMVDSDTAPLAICLAALKAKGIETP